MNGRKRQRKGRFGILDATQKSIESFVSWKKVDKSHRNKTNILRSDTSPIIETKHFDQRKKQTVLVPFDKVNNRNCFRIKKMDCWTDREKSAGVGKHETVAVCEETDSDHEMMELCSQVESSQEKLKHKDDIGRRQVVRGENRWELEIIECSKRAELSLGQENQREYEAEVYTVDAFDNSHPLSIDVGSISCTSSEPKAIVLDIVECCKRVELSMSQEELKLKTNKVRSSFLEYDLAKNEINIDSPSSEGEEMERDMIECCERVELSLSQEKLQQKTNNISSGAVDDDVALNEISAGFQSSDGKEIERDIIECCERVELSMSQEKLQQKNSIVISSVCDENFSQTNNINVRCLSSEESKSALDIIECCKKAELSLNQEKLRNRNDKITLFTLDNDFSHTEIINLGSPNCGEKEHELKIIEYCEKAELPFSRKKFSLHKTNSDGIYTSASCQDNNIRLNERDELGNNFKAENENNTSCFSNNSKQVKASKDKTVTREKQESLALCDAKVKHCGIENFFHEDKPTLTSVIIDDFDIGSNDSETEILELCNQAEQSTGQYKKGNSSLDKQASNSCNGKSMFGLFGVTSSDEEEIDLYSEKDINDFRKRSYFNELPDEILENIFCPIPLIDLLMNLSLVCKRWYEIISSEKFLLWKKRYYQYKSSYESRKEIDSMIIQEQLHLPMVFPSHLCRYLSKFRVFREDHSKLLDGLRLHSKYHLIENFMQEIGLQQSYSCWSVVGLLSLVSNSVYDIQEIIACLLRSSTCLLYDILECFHCLALIYFILMEKSPSKFSSHHYRIYYALYLLENTSHCTQTSLKSAYSANRSGQQCILKYRESSETTWLTHEQVRIMNHNTAHGDILKIVAFAGTGKTTTLVEYTKLRPSWKFLNVAYNKSVQEQAVRKFPRNVESRTVHSLAYTAVGFKFRGKMASSHRVSNIMDNLPEKSANFLHAKRVIDTLTNFISSYDDCISLEHVPYCGIISDNVEGDRSKLEFFNSDTYKKSVVKDSKDIWDKMCDPKNRDVRITHDGYLKMYQLSKPVIRDYDCILVDEAQDCTPAVADILLSQTIAKILVGDPHQQIYGFRGATNAMEQVNATHVYYLTQSFRFGSEIASVASSLLDILKGVRNKNIVGVDKAGRFNGDHLGQIAVICRTNFALFNNAVLVCTRNNKTRISFAGGIQGYNLDRILDIYRLYSGADKDGIKDRFIKRFRTLGELKKYARKAPDPELLGKIKIVEAHNIHIPKHVERIKNQNCNDIDQAEIIFSTAHKAKGLEFDTVQLGEDFLIDYDYNELRDAPTDEKNLLYVAVTRAKHRLQCSRILYNILLFRTDLLLTCETIKSAEVTESTYCAECKRLCDLSESCLAMRRAQVVLGTTQKMDGGFLCSKCALKCSPLMGNLLLKSSD